MIVDSYVLNIARYLHRDFPVTRFSFRQLFSPFSHLQRYFTDICIITRTTIFFKHKAYYCKKNCRFTIHLLQSMRIYKDDTIIKSIPEIFFSKSVTNAWQLYNAPSPFGLRNIDFKSNKHIISLPNLYMSLLVKTQDATAEYFFCTSKC